MALSFNRATLAVLGGVLAGTVAFAGGLRWAEFTPLATSAGPTADESAPITFGNPDFQQRSIIDRNTQLLTGPNSGNFDMITLNETGPLRGRYLFTVFETSEGGIMRHDLVTGQTDTIWHALAPNTHVAFDASYWTPWGTFITAEESWCTNAAGCTSPFGRLFELKNPLDAPPITGALTAGSNDGAVLVHQNVIPRTSHEGIQFDSGRNLYFIDELNGGSIYKFVTAAKMRDVMAGTADYFAAGQTFVLRVGDGNTDNATGAFTWVPITDRMGAGLPGALTITDTNGVTSVDARNTTDLPAFKGTNYQRPEDLQYQKINGVEYMFVATTTTNEVYRIDLTNGAIAVYANRSTINLASGSALGSALASPDNLALDEEGTLYVIEDRNGGSDDDIWAAVDLNKDGDVLDAGEGFARWASNGTPGSEFSGLYFDFMRRRAWVNIQHPNSDNDRMIEITTR